MFGNGRWKVPQGARSIWKSANCLALLARNGRCYGRESGNSKNARTLGGRSPSKKQERLLEGLKDCLTPHLRVFVPLLLLTGIRAGEALSLTWGQLDLIRRTITVGKAKTSSGTGRMIPINEDLSSVLLAHRIEFIEAFGEPLPQQFVFAWGSPLPSDPTRHVTDLKRGWENLRERAGVSCRLHDLRHTFATRLAENGAPESTMLALMGHMSRAMLERYSHIRMAAKIKAVEGIRLHAGGPNPTVPVKVPVVGESVLIQ